MPDAGPATRDFGFALLALDRSAAGDIIFDLAERSSPLLAVEKTVVPALEWIGRGWEEGTVALSQVYMSGRICEQLVDELLPPGSSQRKAQPKMAIATLEDYHLLGKRIVYATLRASGYDLKDYGHGIGAAELAESALEDDIEILLVSTLMLRSALAVKKVKEILNQRGFSGRIVVGGAPYLFDDDLWVEVGADAMCRSASEVLTAIEKVMEV
jgi:methanogenic corrinoid protein MtbC1